MAEQNISTDPQPRKLNKISPVIFVFLLLILISLVTVYIREQKAIRTVQQLIAAQVSTSHFSYQG